MKVLIIDSNNLVHRVYWVSKNKIRFNKYFHVYLFLVSVKHLIQEFLPDVTYCVWDEKQSDAVNPRELLYPEYKKNRHTEFKKDVYSQNFLIKGALKTLNIKNILPLKYEADDVIAILQSFFKNTEIQIVTGDTDLYQLVNSQTTIFNPLKKTLITQENFFKQLNVTKENFLLLKALLGDKSDNIQGVLGIGTKKAQKILNKEIQLTEEQKKIVERNIKLLDLSNTLLDNKEKDFIKSQLSTTPTTDFNKFELICQICEFNKILNNISDWKKTFK